MSRRSTKPSAPLVPKDEHVLLEAARRIVGDNARLRREVARLRTALAEVATRNPVGEHSRVALLALNEDGRRG